MLVADIIHSAGVVSVRCVKKTESKNKSKLSGGGACADARGAANVNEPFSWSALGSFANTFFTDSGSFQSDSGLDADSLLAVAVLPL